MQMTPITSLHSLYGNLTGWVLPMSYWRERCWAEYVRRGHTEDELVKTVMYLRAEVRKGNRNVGCLKFHNLVEDIDRFEEELAISGMRDRQFKEKSKVSDGKRAVLEATGRPVEEAGNSVRPVSELIANLRKAAGMT